MFSKIKISALVLSLLIPGACNTMGPRNVETALSSYDEAIAQTTTQQLLLNLVRLRYRDVPVFLKINSISAQWEFKAGAGLNVGFDSGSKNTKAGALGTIGFAEKPTLSLAPLQGKDFVHQMLAPVPAEAVALLFHSGWKIDRILRSLVQAINDIPYAPDASSPTPERPPEYKKFKRLTKLLRDLQIRHQIDLGVTREGDTRHFFMLVSENARNSSEMQEITQMLHLEAGKSRYEVNSSLYGDPASALRINMRSLSGVLYFFSHAIDIPQEDIDHGVVTVTRREDGSDFDWGEVTDDLLHVHVSKGKPQGAMVSVRYRDYWFYIDDSDVNSKSTFSMLYEIAALQAGDVVDAGPVLTLPLG